MLIRLGFEGIITTAVPRLAEEYVSRYGMAEVPEVRPFKFPDAPDDQMVVVLWKDLAPQALAA
jgi:hypothetical protein